MRGNLESSANFAIDVATPGGLDQAQRRLKMIVPLALFRHGKSEERKLLRRASAAKPDRHPPACQEIGRGGLLGNIERMMQIQTDDCSAEADLFCLSCQVKR